MTHHARGAFTVNVLPLTPAPAEGLGRYSIDKQIHGDLEATTKGEMFFGRRSEAGSCRIRGDRGRHRNARGKTRQFRAPTFCHDGSKWA